LLSGLRKDLGALAVLLLDENGRVLANSGRFPDSLFENRWSESLVETVRASIKVSKLLGSPQPRNLVALQGLAFDLVLSPVGSYALVLALRTGRPTLRMGLAFEEILNIQKNLLALLSVLTPTGTAGAIMPEAKPAPTPSLPIKEFIPAATLKTGPLAQKAASQKAALQKAPPPGGPRQTDEPPSEAFVSLFQEQSGLDVQDVESFWETAPESSTPLAPGSDAITYEQARKLGLAPGLDEEIK
jgi:hypothetical protein